MEVRVAHLPEQVTLYCREPKKAADQTFCDFDAYVVSCESGSDKHENAKLWRNSTAPGPVINIPNHGFRQVQIVDLDIREEGGRAYKVILHHDKLKLRVDMRETALLDVIRNSKIEQGWMTGTFAFIVEGSQTYLVREGSEQHCNAVSGSDRRTVKPIAKQYLEVGNIYEMLNGDQGIFLGELYTRSIDCHTDKGTLKVGPASKKLAFYAISSYAKATAAENYAEYFLEGHSFRLTLKSSHTYRFDRGSCGLSQEDMLPLLREGARTLYQNEAAQQKGDHYPNRGDLLYRLAGLCTFLELSSNAELGNASTELAEARMLVEEEYRHLTGYGIHRRSW